VATGDLNRTHQAFERIPMDRDAIAARKAWWSAITAGAPATHWPGCICGAHRPPPELPREAADAIDMTPREDYL
jgi:hypothetical protein